MTARREDREDVPAAYKLAQNQQEALNARFVSLKATFEENQCISNLLAFLDLVSNGTAAINMSIPRCVKFLETGQYLNVYEATAQESGKDGAALEDAVRERLGDWYERRKYYENLLEFTPNTHYAGLNLGGAGPTRYGECCVHLDVSETNDHATCFAGDSLRTIYSSAGERILDNETILSYFALRSDLPVLAAVRHEKLIQNSGKGLRKDRVRAALEDSDSLIEIHLHCRVLLAHVSRVTMTEAAFESLWERVMRCEGLAPEERRAQEFDAVPPFKRMLDLVDQKKIGLMFV